MTKFKTNKLDPTEYAGSDISGIIGAPLVAAARANSLMAKEQIKFIMAFCFTKKGDVYEPVMIRMSITKGIIDPSQKMGEQPSYQKITTTFELPLLTIIPINSLALTSMEVNFDLEVTSHYTHDATDSAASKIGNQKPDQKTVKLMGKVGPNSNTDPNDTSGKSHYDKSGSSSLKVNMKSSPLPLPLGLASILNIYSKNLHPTELGNQTTDKKP